MISWRSRKGEKTKPCFLYYRMFLVLQVVTVFLASVAMSLALAHVLELPGKMRLNKETYIAVQSIYYPGFTIGGLGEGVETLAALGL
jgi:hypothetical protein